MSHTPEVLHDLSQALHWLRSRVTGQLRTDSRLVQPGDGFIAWPGGVTDGRKHVAAALAQGAVACLVEQKGIEAFDLQGPVARFSGLKAATAEIAAAWCGHYRLYSSWKGMRELISYLYYNKYSIKCQLIVCLVGSGNHIEQGCNVFGMAPRER